MARYKHIDTSPGFPAVDLQQQLIPGTFEHTMTHLIDRELDLTGFDAPNIASPANKQFVHANRRKIKTGI